MKKLELITHALVSSLRPEDKVLLVELLMRADEEGHCWPGVERLCQARGIRHEKNFKGVDVYLPGLVTKTKQRRKNHYWVDFDAVAALSKQEVVTKHTPAPEPGIGHRQQDELMDVPITLHAQQVAPASEGFDSPSRADAGPSLAGANSTKNTSKEETEKRTGGAVPAPSSVTSTQEKKVISTPSSLPLLREEAAPAVLGPTANVLPSERNGSRSSSLPVNPAAPATDEGDGEIEWDIQDRPELKRLRETENNAGSDETGPEEKAAEDAPQPQESAPGLYSDDEIGKEVADRGHRWKEAVRLEVLGHAKRLNVDGFNGTLADLVTQAQLEALKQ